jgi:hypothetical protein
VAVLIGLVNVALALRRRFFQSSEGGAESFEGLSKPS